MGETPFRLQVGYAKRDRLRFLSHLEVTRAIERAARRAALPYAVTEGFHAKMRVAFGPALPVGTAGLHERYELWLRAYVPAAEALAMLQAATPDELGPFEAGYAALKAPSLVSAFTIAVYQVRVEGEARDTGLATAVKTLAGDRAFTVEQKGKSKSFDLTSVLLKEPAVRSTEGCSVIDLVIRMGDQGSLRPEAFVAAALARSEGPGRIVSVTRTDLREEGPDAPGAADGGRC